jgi:proline dehydrogenase
MTGIPYKWLSAAVEACGTLRAHEFRTSLACWPRLEHNSMDLALEYLCAVDEIHRIGLDSHLSLKPLALAFRQDLLTKVAARADSLNVPLHFDSPPAEVADIEFSAISQAAIVHSDIRVTVPGRWRRSMVDAEWALSRGLGLRIVKGEWADPDDPLRDGRAGVLSLVDGVAGRAAHVSIATHDAELAREALMRLRLAGTRCELEVLAGRGVERPLAVARQLGVPVRFYVPYGKAPSPYGT